MIQVDPKYTSIGTYSDYQKQLIGYGLQCPKSFNKSTGGVNINSGSDRINQSIFHILSTDIGERFFLPEFGSRLNELIFEPNDYILHDLIILYTKEALGKWEPRIKVIEVNPLVDDINNNRVNVNIYYNLINTNLNNNYVYPFNRQLMEL